MKKKVCIVLLTYNNPSLLLRSAQSIGKLLYTDYTLVIIDNNSNKKNFNLNRQYIKNIFKNKLFIFVEFIESQQTYLIKSNFNDNINNVFYIYIKEKNKGFAGGNNVGLNFINSYLKCNYLWLLSDDTYVKEDSLTALIEYSKKIQSSDIIIGAKLLKIENNTLTNNIQTYGGCKLNKIIGNSSFVNKTCKIRKIDYITGASLFFNIEILKKNIFFDENYFLYWEDADFSYKVKKMGGKIFVCDNCIVWHEEGGTVKRQIADYYWVRNGLYFAKKYYPQFLPIILIAYLLKFSVIRTLKREDLNFSMFLKGVKDFFIGKTGK